MVLAMRTEPASSGRSISYTVRRLTSGSGLRELAREVGLADARLAEQQHRRQLDRVVGIDAQREVLADGLEHHREVRQVLKQVLHLGERRGLDGEALAAQAQHLLVDGAQRLVGRGRKFLQGFFNGRDFVDVLESRDRNRHCCRHWSPLFSFLLAGAPTPSEKSNMTPSSKQTPRLAAPPCDCQSATVVAWLLQRASTSKVSVPAIFRDISVWKSSR